MIAYGISWIENLCFTYFQLIQPWYSLPDAETSSGMNDTLSLSSPLVFYRPVGVNQVINQEYVITIPVHTFCSFIRNRVVI